MKYVRTQQVLWRKQSNIQGSGNASGVKFPLIKWHFNRDLEEVNFQTAK